VNAISRLKGDFYHFWSLPDGDGISLSWLGQAGFAARCGSVRFVVDPYLCDTLAEKYRGTNNSYERMTSAPASAQDFAGVRYIFCTHAHTDHMDGATLQIVAREFPQCRFVIPRAYRMKARRFGISDEALLPIDAGESLELADGWSVRAFPSAHEQLQTDLDGHHLFLGYHWQCAEMGFYHSGDCVPYDGLSANLRRVDAALLPVNGRGKGVPGNFTFAEAAQLCRDAHIPYLIPHHFGLFAFNSLSRLELEREADATVQPRVFIPDTVSWFSIQPINDPSMRVTELSARRPHRRG
jgi:L-ascorbate metabolism protein UlaG (beta-lactamase superfamily)